MALSLKGQPVKERPGAMRLVHATRYRLPPAGWVSILHRVSGAVLFFLLPFVIWMFDNSVTSEVSYERFGALFVAGVGILPGLLFRLAALGLVWAYLFHFIAGVRHLWMDMTHAVSPVQGRVSAWITIVTSSVLTLLLGAKLFGVY